MKKIYSLVIKSFIGPFFLTFLVAVFILVMIPLIKYSDDIFGKGLDFWIISKLIFYFSIQTTTSASPLALMLAALMTYGNLGEKNELTALKAAGISFQKAITPILVMAILITFATYYVGDTVIPYCNLKLYSLLYDVKQQKPAMEIKSGTFYGGIDGYSIKLTRPDPLKDDITNVMIYNHTDSRGNTNVILADSGKMYRTADKQYLKVELFKGVNYAEVLNRSNQPSHFEFVRTYFDNCELMFDLSSFSLTRTKEELFAGNRSMLNEKQLRDTIGKVHGDISQKRDGFVDQLKIYFHHYRLDSTLKLPSAKPLSHRGEFLSYFNHDQQLSIIQNALNQVRGAQSFSSVYSKIIQQQSKEMRKMEMEWHFKFTMSIACIMMFLIGAPLGAIVKKGGFGFPVIISIFFYILYYVLTIMGKKWSQEAIYSVPSGMWFSTVMLFPAGFYFYFIAINDLSVWYPFNLKRFIKRIF